MVAAIQQPQLGRCRVTGRPLDREAITASDLALAIAPTDSYSGHLNNALCILDVGGWETTNPDDGGKAVAFDAATLRDVQARIIAALTVARETRFDVTDEGRAALGQAAV
jgi:hypothetical protein